MKTFKSAIYSCALFISLFIEGINSFILNSFLYINNVNLKGGTVLGDSNSSIISFGKKAGPNTLLE